MSCTSSESVLEEDCVEIVPLRISLPEEAESEGESVGTIYTMRIDNAGVEVKITAGRCIITDKEGKSKQFDKSKSQRKQESLAHIETLLK
ncbi:MAG: hypothetical protein ACETWQ_03155 [Phycisphaerae bacterium]